MNTIMPNEFRDQFCSAEKLKATFEDFVKSSDRFKDNTPLGTMVINGAFHHYMDADTDTMWIGFAIGYRCAVLEYLDTLTKPL